MFAAQHAFDRISFKTVAEIYYSHGGKNDVQKSEAWIRRDGDRMDSIGKYVYVGKEAKSYNFRSVIDKERFIQHTAPLSGDDAKVDSKKLTAATSIDRRQYFFRVGRVPHYGGFLDGYFGGIDFQSIFTIMLDAPDAKVVEGETIDGVATKKITATTKFGEAKIWIDPANGYTLRKIEFRRNPEAAKTNTKSDGPKKTPEERRLVSQLLVMDKVTTKSINGVHVPDSGSLQIESKYSDNAVVKLVFHCQRSEIDLAPTFADDAFRMQLPNGVAVFDWDHPQSGLRHVWKNGKIDLADADFSLDAKSRFATTRNWLLIAINGIVLIILAILVVKRAGWFSTDTTR